MKSQLLLQELKKKKIKNNFKKFPSLVPGAPSARRGRGGHRGGRGRFGIRRDGPMKFEKDFDFESANAQFNKEEIDREFHNKLKLKGKPTLALDLSVDKISMSCCSSFVAALGKQLLRSITLKVLFVVVESKPVNK